MDDTDTIKVSLFRKPGNRIWHLQYRDPETGYKRRKSSGTTNKREAERLAGKWEAEVREGRIQSNGRIAWGVFRDRFEQRYLPGLKDTTGSKYIAVLNVMESFRKPRQLRYVTSEFLSQYQQYLRENGRSEATIRSHLRHIRRLLQWSVDNSYLARVPAIPKTQRAKSQRVMKGRPLVGEEFERMLVATDKVILQPNRSKKKEPREPDLDRIPSWKYLLRGLWLSGLRLSEAMDLHWSDTDCIRVDLNGKFPMLRIPSAKEKGNTDRILPMTPDFAEFILETPEPQRKGYVFDPLPQNPGHPRLLVHAVGVRIGQIGEKAGIIVCKSRNGKPKYATAHDLRRSFGTRWSSRVMPAVLKELMRHASIDTTMRYYVGANADQTAADLWKLHALGSILGSDVEPTDRDALQTPKKQ